MCFLLNLKCIKYGLIIDEKELLVFFPMAPLTRDYSKDFEEFASAVIGRTSSNELKTNPQILNLHIFLSEETNQHTLNIIH